jgi:fumarate reductase iron-sulfur subunit
VPDSGRSIEMEILRYLPERGSEPFYQVYEVPFEDDWSVLQGLQYIKDDLDGTLSFRWSCRMAICGSCGLMIDGVPRLGCRTFLRNFHPGRLRVTALEHFPIERDLVIVADDFIDKLKRAEPYLIPKQARRLEQGEYLQSPDELERYRRFSTCINCMLCYAACPQYGLNPDFTGPGILALLHRYNADSRDGGSDRRMSLGHSDAGFWGCTAVAYCSEVCPKEVDPANAINQNKMGSAIDYFLRFLRPRGDAE